MTLLKALLKSIKILDTLRNSLFYAVFHQIDPRQIQLITHS